MPTLVVARATRCSLRQIDFNEEVRKESDEVLEAERIAKEADNKPLWEQLAGKREEKQAKFDAVRASMFGRCTPNCLVSRSHRGFLPALSALLLQRDNMLLCFCLLCATACMEARAWGVVERVPHLQ